MPVIFVRSDCIATDTEKAHIRAITARHAVGSVPVEEKQATKEEILMVGPLH